MSPWIWPNAYRPEVGNCPYCAAAGLPVGVDCEHWTGNGWSKDPVAAARGRRTNRIMFEYPAFHSLAEIEPPEDLG